MNFRENPFWLLETSPRDSKRVLHDKAEDKSFELPEEVCRNAENILITPKLVERGTASRLIIIHALYCAEKILIDFIIFYFFQTNTVFGQFVHEFFAADQVNLLFAGI